MLLRVSLIIEAVVRRIVNFKWSYEGLSLLEMASGINDVKIMYPCHNVSSRLHHVYITFMLTSRVVITKGIVKSWCVFRAKSVECVNYIIISIIFSSYWQYKFSDFNINFFNIKFQMNFFFNTKSYDRRTELHGCRNNVLKWRLNNITVDYFCPAIFSKNSRVKAVPYRWIIRFYEYLMLYGFWKIPWYTRI